MKIMRLFSKEVKGTKYYKYSITLPKEVVKDSGLLDKELEAKITDNKIVIESV